MHGAGYLWKTESDSESKRNMTASARKRYSAKRQQNESARKKRWGKIKTVAALGAVAGLGYYAYRKSPRKSLRKQEYAAKKMPDSYTIGYPERRGWVSRIYQGDEGFDRVKKLTGKYANPRISGDVVAYESNDSDGRSVMSVNIKTNEVHLSWTPSSYWIGRVFSGNPSTDKYVNASGDVQDVRRPFKRLFHLLSDHATLENNFMLSFTPHYVHGHI